MPHEKSKVAGLHWCLHMCARSVFSVLPPGLNDSSDLSQPLVGSLPFVEVHQSVQNALVSHSAIFPHSLANL